MAESPQFTWTGNRGTYSETGFKARCRLVGVGDSETRAVMTWNKNGETGEIITKLPFSVENTKSFANGALFVLLRFDEEE